MHAQKFDHALAHHQAGRWAEAERIYREILAADGSHADSLHMLGVLAYQVGRHDIAAELIGTAIARRSDIPFYHSNLGNVWKALGRLAEAEACYRKALDLKPDYADAHNNLGTVRHAQGRLDEAAKHYRQALRVAPDNAEAHDNLGTTLRKRGDLPAAAEHGRRAIAIRPGNAEAHVNLGTTLFKLGDLDAAAAHYRQALALNPNSATAHAAMANLVGTCGDFITAEAHYRMALAIAPDNGDIHNNLGATLESQGRFDEAIAHLERALVLQPQDALAHYNLGNAHQDQGDLAAATACYERALAIDPDYPDAHVNLGNALRDLGRNGEALEHYRRAIAARPDHADAHWNEALVLLLMGDFAAGWPKYEYRWLARGTVPHGMTAPAWDGGDLHGRTLLVHCEQGFGDSLQFVRHVPLLRERGGQVALACPKGLARLFAEVEGVERLVTAGDDIPPHDCHVPLASLPGLFGTTVDTIPAAVPYLRPPRAEVDAWAERLAAHGGFRVGVVWRGRVTSRQQRERALGTALLGRCLTDVTVVGLLPDAAADELAEFPGAVVDAGKDLADFASTAAVMANLDLVVSVDTAAAHLAGAVGVPVWTLLPFAADWRWLLERDDSPWYPTMRLFRQPSPGDWESVVERVRAELETLR